MKYTALCLVVVSFLVGAVPVAAMEEGLHISSAMGLSQSLDSRLTTVENGVKRSFTAEWDGKPFSDSTYYAWRIENWSEGESLGFEFIHHKIYLKNFPDYLERFSVSDGYNLIYVNKGWEVAPNRVVRLGFGAVLSHPDVKFTGGSQFHRQGGLANSGFYFAGPSVQASYSSRLWETERHYVNWETKLSLSYAKFPVTTNENDYAEDVNIAFHVLLNIGSKPLKKDQTDWTDVGQYILPAFFPVTSGLLIDQSFFI